VTKEKSKPFSLLEPISDENYRELFELIQNPPRGSAIEAAKEFGIELYTTLENLRLTPGERMLQGMRFSEFANELREAGRKAGL
jgi:hypothetical protein